MTVSGLPAVSKVWNFGSHAPRGLASPWPRTGGRCPRAHFVGESPRARATGLLEATSQTMPGDISASSIKKRPFTFQKFQESELFRKKNLTTSLKFIVPSLWVFFNFPPPPKKRLKKSPLTNFPQRHHMAPPKRAWAEFP